MFAMIEIKQVFTGSFEFEYRDESIPMESFVLSLEPDGFDAGIKINDF